ncbi:unnamed protein product [Adineta ricciae]|uniref:F-box domain-containing protein n=1 Tax=Adineta ricciae TaxID=249248 RepID=A0A814NIJ6_ADIRI|nr:unnamed protein product [Adineta ricciae]CAF1638298.1 unnamed protein product [Adineta ricciae]
MVSTFEHLPDEILLTICQFLSQYHIIHGFYDLNHRLNCTVAQFTTSFFMQRRYVYDQDQNQEILSTIGRFLRSLTVKDVKLSSQDLLLTPNIHELTFIRTCVCPLPPLVHLTDLNIFNPFPTSVTNTLFTSNPNLHSVFICSTSVLINLPPPTGQTSAIKQLAVTLQSLSDLPSLLRFCPHLTCLNLNLQREISLENSFPTINLASNLAIFSLRTPYEVMVDFARIKHVFKYLPSTLEILAVEIYTTDSTCLNGQSWENSLTENFPNLHHMEFFIYLKTDLKPIGETLKLPDVLKTFKTPYLSTIIPQQIAGDYNSVSYVSSLSIFTQPAPTVRRRRYFIH